MGPDRKGRSPFRSSAEALLGAARLQITEPASQPFVHRTSVARPSEVEQRLPDLRRRRLVGSRDRFGIKPLYWATRGPRLLLASEIKQILAACPEARRANAGLVARYRKALS